MPDTQNRKLAAILFADIAGYTALMQRDEEAALQKLTRFKNVLERQIALFHGHIIQYYGDGCLILFESSVDAVSFAIAIQGIFREDPRVPVRVGIHAGDVLLKEGLVFGDAVNITSRIESMGIPGTVLLSEAVCDQIKNKREFQLTSLGSFDFKNVYKPMEVFALSNEGLSVPKRAEMEGKMKSHTPERKRSTVMWVLLVLFLSIVAFAGWRIWNNKTNSSIGEQKEKSIAVMPLRNLSGDQSQDYFADGVVEAIYSKLAQVSNLRVTSMTSMLGYRNQPKPIPEIAKELRVNHILEGSVSRDQNTVRITVRLVDGNTDRQLWTRTYERQLLDIFMIQNDIAQSVVNALETTLSPVEQSRLAKLEVADITAYDLYLSGLDDFHEYGFTLDTSLNESALRKSYKAIHLDPRFDDGLVLLANCWYSRRNYGFGDVSLDSAEFYADQALRINSSASDALSLKGSIAWDKVQYEESKQFAEKALDIAPNNSPALRLLASYYMFESESIEKSVPLLVKAIALNPKNRDKSQGNQSLYLDLGSIYLRADLLKEAEALFLKALELSSGKKSLETVTLLGYLYHVSGKFDKSIEYRKQQLNLSPDDFGAINEYAGVHYAAGNVEEAEKHYRILQDRIEKGYRETYRSYIFRHRLAHILWMTGRREEAQKLFNEHLTNEMADLAQGTRHFGQEYAIAGTYAAMGEKEKAYEWLEKMPFWYITYQFIRVDPMFKSLRGEDRYERIMAKHHEKIQRLQASIKTLEADGQLQLMLK
ncbi:MAG TPA: adenylate/guanylate cyclase domain-containing protein [Saprospiraceae bacterium]|nr:adenylate/guanylate cyclase domain-containing protein [Saprospiraceae bacterium]